MQKMHEESIRVLAKKLRSGGRMYHEIGDILGLGTFSARKLCTYKRLFPKKREPKLKINKKINLAIKKKVMQLTGSGEEVWSAKIIKDLRLNVSPCTVQSIC